MSTDADKQKPMQPHMVLRILLFVALAYIAVFELAPRAYKDIMEISSVRVMLDDMSGYEDRRKQTMRTTGVTGLTFVYMPGDLFPVVGAVYKGTAAKEAAINTGLYLTGVNGKSCLPMSKVEITRALRGEPGSFVDVTLAKAPGYDERTYHLKRMSIYELPDKAERLELLHAIPDQVAAAPQDAIEMPAFNSERTADSMAILEFYDSNIGTAKDAPKYLNSKKADSTTPAKVRDTLVIHFDINNLVNKELAARFGITKAPAFVFLPERKGDIHEGDIEREPLTHPASRLVGQPPVIAIPGH